MLTFSKTVIGLVLTTLLIAHADATGTLEVVPGAAFTGGFGLEATIGPPCTVVNELTVNSPATIAGPFSACSRLTANNVQVTGTATFTAGVSVALGEKFSVANGASFSAGIDPSLTPLAFVSEQLLDALSRYKTSFRLRLNDLTLVAGDQPAHLRGYSNNGAIQFEVGLKRTIGENRLVLKARNDNGSVVTATEVTVPDGWNPVEIDWLTGNGNGHFLVTVGGTPFGGLTNLDNDMARIARVDWGVVGGEIPTAIGKLQVDDFRAVNALAASGAACSPTGGTGGLTPGTHDTTLAGRPATIIVGDGYNPTTPTFLAYYLHGDEGGYDFHTNPFSDINQFINDQDWIYVAPQAPPDPTNANSFPWDGRNGGSISGNADQVAAVLDDMFAKYNVCRNTLFGGSISGGSWFHDAYFFPKRGGEYPSFINRCCGASQLAADSNIFGSLDDLDILGANPDIVARSEFKFTIGTNDFLYLNALSSEPVYQAAGFSVIADHLPGVGHCAFDFGTSIRDYWMAKLETEIFTDGFESGDVSAWSGSVP